MWDGEWYDDKRFARIWLWSLFIGGLGGYMLGFLLTANMALYSCSVSLPVEGPCTWTFPRIVLWAGGYLVVGGLVAFMMTVAWNAVYGHS